MSKTQSSTIKLSDAQLELLSVAAKRPNGSLLPFRENLTVRSAALKRRWSRRLEEITLTHSSRA
jgi:hypothetical protein